jgi:hypothetical protein
MWQPIGTINPQPHWISFPAPIGAASDIVRVKFQFHGSVIRIYSRILIRQIYYIDSEFLRTRPIRVFPDMNEQIISFPLLSQGDLLYIEIKRYWRSWRWRSVQDSAHLIELSCYVA